MLTLMVAFLLYQFQASWPWWIAFVCILLIKFNCAIFNKASRGNF